MITIDTAPEFLIDVGLISSQTVIDGDLDIVSVTRRNRNLQVTTRDRGGFLVKQPSSTDEASMRTLRTEAEFYSFCHEHPALEKVRRVLPQLLFHDPAEGRLILELLDGTLPLWRYYKDQTADRFPVEAIHQVGRLVGALHNDFERIEARRQSPGFLADELPWALTVDRPTPEKLSRMSPGHFELVKLLQAEEAVVEGMNGLRRGWKATSIVHGDVKLDNFLVGDGEDRLGAVYLIDWEMVQLGDPAWDLAGALQDFIFWWVLNMPHDKEPEEMVREARFPLSVLQPGIHSLWQGYRDTRALDRSESEAFLDRAIVYSGARMLQTATEMASKFQTLPAPAALMSQVGVNLFAEPETARSELYGFES